MVAIVAGCKESVISFLSRSVACPAGLLKSVPRSDSEQGLLTGLSSEGIYGYNIWLAVRRRFAPDLHPVRVVEGTYDLYDDLVHCI